MSNEYGSLPVSATRRRLIATGAAWPLLAFGGRARAQSKPPLLIGWISLFAREPNIARVSAFHEGMAALGWKAGTHYVLEEHWGEGRRERMPALVQALAARKPAVIVANPAATATMAAKAAPATPIVYFGSDALASGLVKTLARPGGMITGVSNVNIEINAKLIELLLEAMPSLRRIGFFADPAGPTYGNFVTVVQRAAAYYHFETSIAHVLKPEDIEPAVARLAKDKVQALVLLSAAPTVGERHKVISLARVQRWPVVVNNLAFAEAGALFVYGADAAETHRRVAYFVDRILKGANPGDLPIEQPTKFEMVLNLKTAKALGITIPQSILVRANRVIE